MHHIYYIELLEKIIKRLLRFKPMTSLRGEHSPIGYCYKTLNP